MLSKLNSRFLATSISVAALTIGMAFSQQATQKAAAQTATDGAVQAFRNGDTDFVLTNTAVDTQAGEVQVPIANLVISLPYNNGVGNLDQNTVCGIFRGDITDFNQVGGPDQPITVVYRSDDNAIKAVFNNYCGITDSNYPASGIGVTSSNDVTSTVTNTPGAIGYVERASLNGLPDAAASPIIGPINALARSQYDSAEKSDAIKSFLTQILNNDDQIRSLGYQPLDDKSGSQAAVNSIQP